MSCCTFFQICTKKVLLSPSFEKFFEILVQICYVKALLLQKVVDNQGIGRLEKLTKYSRPRRRSWQKPAGHGKNRADTARASPLQNLPQNLGQANVSPEKTGAGRHAPRFPPARRPPAPPRTLQLPARFCAARRESRHASGTAQTRAAGKKSKCKQNGAKTDKTSKCAAAKKRNF